MQFLRKKIIPAQLILVMILAAARFSHGEVVDKIAIVVNDEIITESEITRALHPAYEKYKGLYSQDKLLAKLEEAKQNIVQQFINDRLILSEAKKLNIEIDDKEVDKRIDDLIKRLGSKEAFERTLFEQRITIKDLKTRYREQLMTRRLIDQKVGANIVITPIDITNYYNKNTAEFSQPEEVKLKNILISLGSNTDSKKAPELAMEISRRLKEGCDFAGLAKVYSAGPGASEGGDMGYVKKGDLMPEIEKVVFNLKEGETSDIIQTGLGYHIFKIEEKKPARTLTISEARRDIEETVFREKINQKIKGWVESLKKNAYIAFK
ncbi:MAG: peptidylprolyl isomerase [Candidatus Omnitrophica bacterium]|nr:peptidylprolyl isomerase [Candidatus Omnitrophota bacterium]